MFKATSRTKILRHIEHEMQTPLAGLDHFVIDLKAGGNTYSWSSQRLIDKSWVVEQIRDKEVIN